MKKRPLTLLWFRQDLRLGDNPALCAAAEHGDVLPIYILDDVNAGDWKMGAASRVWLQRSLTELNQSLEGRLQIFSGDARTIITGLVDALPIGGVFWNRCYEPWRIDRDARLKDELVARDLEVRSFNASLLREPWQVKKRDGMFYRVFTPYYQKGCRSAAPPRQPLARPPRLQLAAENTPRSLPLTELDLVPDHDWQRKLRDYWEIGEAAAQQRLEAFCEGALGNYRRGRDFPAADATSRLSPHLHFGELSPHQAWHRVEHAAMHVSGDGPAHFLREIAWREFSYYLLYHYRDLPGDNFNPRFDDFEWSDDESDLDAWQSGRTGFPIVDAGMRELWQTGYMHNRVRMIVASFLIKNMLIHWRRGADWFRDCLVDADLAINSASWQWCAGSGADAAPYFRIFNPVLQSEKFDPQGAYLDRFCPELAALPLRYRHQPWAAPEPILLQAGVKLGTNYPRPILDLKTTRERALARFRALP